MVRMGGHGETKFVLRQDDFVSEFANMLGGIVSMAVWKLKSCPRCNDGLFIKNSTEYPPACWRDESGLVRNFVGFFTQREIDGWNEECLSSGYQRDVSNLVTIDTVGRVKHMKHFRL